jgi:hypothetical protein
VAQEVKHLPSKNQALSLKLTTTNNNNNNNILQKRDRAYCVEHDSAASSIYILLKPEAEIYRSHQNSDRIVLTGHRAGNEHGCGGGWSS